MAICAKCGVELDPGLSTCPLCGEALARPERGSEVPCDHSSASKLVEDLIDPEGRENLTDRERKTIVWEMRSVSIAIASAAVLGINLLISRRLSWSLYPVFSLVFLWSMATADLVFRTRRFGVVVVAAVGLPLLCIGLNLIDGGPAWSVSIALPIILVVEAGIAIFFWAYSITKRRGINVIAFGLVVVSGICVAIETTLALALRHSDGFSWSVIVAFCLLPVAAFLFYIHYRARRKSSFRRIFHL